VVSDIFEKISKNSGNIEKYLTESYSEGAVLVSYSYLKAYKVHLV